jgi:hypothetical protein
VEIIVAEAGEGRLTLDEELKRVGMEDMAMVAIDRRAEEVSVGVIAIEEAVVPSANAPAFWSDVDKEGRFMSGGYIYSYL